MEQDTNVEKIRQLSDLFQPLHLAFWKKPLGPIVRELNIDSNMFRYVPTEFLQDLGLHRLNYSTPILLFLEEYDTALTMLKSWEKPPVTGVVVTGYPGIGKTYFSLFVLLDRLSLGLPTAVQYSRDAYILFSDSGPASYDGDSVVDLPSGTWALTDSNSGVPCLAFQRSPRDVFVVQTTSPQPHQYKEWKKQRRGVRMFVMECVTVIELKALGQLYSFNDDALVEYYSHWGPSVHTCFDLAEGTLSLETMELKSTCAARKFAKTLLGDSDPADISNIFFSIHPTTSSREDMEAMIATEHVLNIILEQVTWLDAAQQSQFFTMISGHPWLKSPLSNFYEKLMHVRLTADPDAAPLMCTSTTEPPLSIPVVPNVVSLSGSSNLKDANQNNLPFYWQPVSHNFMSLDAIICTQENIFLLQITVSPKHSVNVQGLNFIRDHIPTRFWERRRCCLVFIAPDRSCHPVEFESIFYTRKVS